MLNTIDRTGKVLNLFTAEAPEWGVTEMATALELPKSTTFDIAASLAKIGLLQQTADDRYRLGWRVLLISHRLMSSSCFDPRVHRVVAELARHLDAVVTIGVCDGHDVICVANASATRTEPVLTDGAHIAGHTSALGKLLLAQLPWSEVRARIDGYGLHRLTENSVSDANVLRAQLVSARRFDVAIDDGETFAGHSCVAVGIYQRETRAIAALSICAPTARMQRRYDECARIARRAARAVLQKSMSPAASPLA